MKIKKRYLFTLVTFAIALLSTVSVIISVNLILKNDVYEESQIALKEYMANFSSFEQNKVAVAEDFTGDYHLEDAFTGSNIMVNELDFDEDLYHFYHKTEKELIAYVKSDHFALNKVYSTDIEGHKLYFALYGDKKPYLIYVNTAEYLYILKKLNQMFLIISILVLFSATLIGYKIGAQLEKSEQRLKRFFSNASHELKTPLTSIQGYTESIYLGVTTNVQASSKIVLDQCKLMEKHIEELLLLSKIDSGIIKLNLNEFNIYDTLDRLVSYTRPLAEKNNIELKMDFDSDEVILNCDEKYIYNAISAVLYNGIKYAHSQVVIMVRNSKKHITITIKDDGKGIDKKDLPHIFERFYSSEKGNSGIGLSLTEEIIKLHNGTIVAKNDNGAVFEFVLRK